MAHAPRKKSLEELKAEAIAELERRGLNDEAKRQHRSGNY
jgi:hypothetical protein